NEHSADATDPNAIRDEQTAENRGRRAEGEEDEREPDDEEQRVDEGRAPRAAGVVEREPRDEGDVARNERKHARREKAREPSAERDRYTDGARQRALRGGRAHHRAAAVSSVEVVLRAQISRLPPGAATSRWAARARDAADRRARVRRVAPRHRVGLL